MVQPPTVFANPAGFRFIHVRENAHVRSSAMFVSLKEGDVRLPLFWLRPQCRKNAGGLDGLTVQSLTLVTPDRLIGKHCCFVC